MLRPRRPAPPDPGPGPDSVPAREPTEAETLQWLAGLGEHAAAPAPGHPAGEWAARQNDQALRILAARIDHPDAYARAAVVLLAPPWATEAEYRYGLRAWPADTARCGSCGRHHGDRARCRECGGEWNITAEEPLYDHRPGRLDDPAAVREGLCFSCGMATAALPEPRHALPEAPGQGAQLEPGAYEYGDQAETARIDPPAEPAPAPPAAANGTARPRKQRPPAGRKPAAGG